MTHEPTPDEIAEACWTIRASWSDDEHVRRLRIDERPQPAVTPTARLATSEPVLPDVL